MGAGGEKKFACDEMHMIVLLLFDRLHSVRPNSTWYADIASCLLGFIILPSKRVHILGTLTNPYELYKNVSFLV